MPKAFYKHKVTLDENFPHRSRFPLLNKQFDVKNIREDLKKGGATDNDVYNFLVVSANMLAAQIDKKLTALLKKRSPKCSSRKICYSFIKILRCKVQFSSGGRFVQR